MSVQGKVYSKTLKTSGLCIRCGLTIVGNAYMAVVAVPIESLSMKSSRFSNICRPCAEEIIEFMRFQGRAVA